MKLKSVLLLCLLLTSLTGFSQLQNFTINGKLDRKFNGQQIRLYYEDKNIKKVDSALIEKGIFKLTGAVNLPTVAKLSFGNEENGDRIDLFLSEGTINLSAEDSIHYASIRGAKLAEEHELLAKKLRPVDDKIFNGLSAYKKMPEGEAKAAFITKVLGGLDRYYIDRRTIINQFASEYPGSYVSLYYLNKTSPPGLANYETTYPFFAKLTPELKATAMGKSLEERLLAVKGKMTGQVFKDFISTTPEGKELSLKEVISKNKYTLVDFWASWCGPCRKENPNVVKAFNAFKDKGFTVISVSLDDVADKWKEAIEKDGMPWYHVSSLKGWKEPAAILYGIKAIPQNVLINSQGKIVATNLRAETLYNKIKELML